MSTDPTAFDIRFNPVTRRMSGTARHGDTPFDVPFITNVAPNLWVGGCESGLVLPEEINHVVSLYPWESYTVRHELSSYMFVRQYDSDEGPDEAQLVTLARWVNQCRRTGPTLVHCQAGLNRSSRLAALALMDEGLTAAEAVNLLREKRSPAVLCNKSFLRWLHDRGAEALRAPRDNSRSRLEAGPLLSDEQILMRAKAVDSIRKDNIGATVRQLITVGMEHVRAYYEDRITKGELVHISPGDEVNANSHSKQ